jgi:hypothetical protein
MLRLSWFVLQVIFHRTVYNLGFLLDFEYFILLVQLALPETPPAEERVRKCFTTARRESPQLLLAGAPRGLH